MADMMDNALFEVASDVLVRWESDTLATLSDAVLIRLWRRCRNADVPRIEQALARARLLWQADKAASNEA